MNDFKNKIFFSTKKKKQLVYLSNRWYYIANNGILWLKELFSNIFLVGTEFFTLYDSGNIEKISFRSIGSKIDVDKPLLRIETEKPGCCGGFVMKTVFAPWQMKIIELNEELKNNFNLVIEDPFDKAWVYKVQVLSTKRYTDNFRADFKSKLIPPNNKDLLKKEIREILRNNDLISMGEY